MSATLYAQVRVGSTFLREKRLLSQALRMISQNQSSGVRIFKEAEGIIMHGYQMGISNGKTAQHPTPCASPPYYFNPVHLFSLALAYAESAQAVPPSFASPAEKALPCSVEKIESAQAQSPASA